MRKGTALLGLGIAVVAWGAQQPNLVVENGHLDRAGYPEIKVVGVCDLLTPGARCWDLSGKLDPEMAAKVWTLLTGNQNHNIQIRPGKKNRWVVVESTRERGSQTGTERTFQGWDTPEGGYNVSVNGPGIGLDLNRITSVEEQKSIDMVARINVPLPSTTFIIQKGKPVEAFGRKGEIVKIVPTRSDRLPSGRYYGYFDRVQDLWSYTVSLQDGPAINYGTLTPLDAKGQTIRFVDAKGVPVPEHIALANPTPYMGGFNNGVNSKYRMAMFMLQVVGGNTFDVLSNVNPAYVRSALHATSTMETVLFKNIPLDPR